MSHKANHWLAEVPAEAIKAGAFRVLFHLCDAHNSHRDHSDACFPSQKRLMAATGLSNGGLNNALNALEDARLMRRRRTRKEDGTKGPTYYILGCDIDLSQVPTPENGGGTNSSFGAQPTPVFDANQLQPTGDKPVSEPVSNLVPSDDSTQTDLFLVFWVEYPRPRNEDRSRKLFAEAVKGGADPEHIVKAAEVYAVENKDNGRQYVAFSDNWLNDQRWNDYKAPKAPPTQEQIDERWAVAIVMGQTWARNHITEECVARLIKRERVTVDQVEAFGITVRKKA